jgi:hypothetical protein
MGYELPFLFLTYDSKRSQVPQFILRTESCTHFTPPPLMFDLEFIVVPYMFFGSSERHLGYLSFGMNNVPYPRYCLQK